MTFNLLAQQIKVLNEILHLMTGTPTWIFDQEASQDSKLVDDVWFQSTWEFLSLYNIILTSTQPYLTSPRTHDSFIMPTLISLKIPTPDLIKINKCRTYLRLLTISDLVDASGQYVLLDYMNRHRTLD